MKKIFVLFLLTFSLTSCSNPAAPDSFSLFPEPRGDICMLVGESKVFTAAGIFGGYEYSWSHFRPDSNEDLYSKVESLSPDQVKFTALKETRECHFIGGCIETPVYLVVYLLDHKGLHSGGQTNTAAIHIGCSGRYFPRS